MAGWLATFPTLTWDLLGCPGYLWVPVLHCWQVLLSQVLQGFLSSSFLVAEGLDVLDLSYLYYLLFVLLSGPLAIPWPEGFACGPGPGPLKSPILSSS